MARAWTEYGGVARVLLVCGICDIPAHAAPWPSSKASPPNGQPKRSDDPLDVEILPAGVWRRLGESPFGFHELVHEVAASRGSAEGLGDSECSMSQSV